MSRSSLGSSMSRGEKKRKLTSLTPDVSEELALEVRTCLPADEVTRQLSEIMRVATTSANLKRTLRDAASYITTAWRDQAAKRTEQAHSSDTTSTRLVNARLTALEEENVALRQELARRPACAHGCPRCDGSVPEPSHPPRTDRSDSERISRLEKRMEEFGPKILRAIEERFGGRRPRTPEPRNKADHSAAPRAAQITPLPPPPRKSKGERNGEW
jgi:hypothetical protein